jgi:hypothetical protein
MATNLTLSLVALGADAGGALITGPSQVIVAWRETVRARA